MLAEPNLTRRMFDAVDARGRAAQAGGAGGATSLQALLAADQAWYNIRHGKVCVFGGGKGWCKLIGGEVREGQG